MSPIVFWVALAVLVYTGIVFPLMVLARGWLIRRPFKTDDVTPQLSVIVCAYNEQDNIRARLENLLSLDYPKERLEILIASDGSSDGTDAIVAGYEGQGVRLLSLPRQGKIPAMNTASRKARGEILVFSDANTMFAPDAIRALVRPFADPTVGGVAGDQRYSKEQRGGLTSDGERSYWNFDRILKRAQSRAGNVISATGAIYAIRRALFRQIPLGVTDDFVVSTRVIALGYRLVFAEDAVAYEPVADGSSAEFRRKVRVITQGMRSIQVMRRLLNPWRFGFYSVDLFSHKVLRRLVVFPLLALLTANLALWNQGWFYQMTLAAQVAFYGCALAGVLLGGTRIGRLKPLSIPLFVCMVNAAALLATVRLITGRRIERWEPQRSESPTDISIPQPAVTGTNEKASIT